MSMFVVAYTILLGQRSNLIDTHGVPIVFLAISLQTMSHVVLRSPHMAVSN